MVRKYLGYKKKPWSKRHDVCNLPQSRNQHEKNIYKEKQENDYHKTQKEGMWLGKDKEGLSEQGRGRGILFCFLPWVIEPKHLLYITVVLENEHIFSYT